jgi:hypothetical protein
MTADVPTTAPDSVFVKKGSAEVWLGGEKPVSDNPFIGSWPATASLLCELFWGDRATTRMWDQLGGLYRKFMITVCTGVAPASVNSLHRDSEIDVRIVGHLNYTYRSQETQAKGRV